jgi:glycosyltransferase involved in cell wall biosynthesis
LLLNSFVSHEENFKINVSSAEPVNNEIVSIVIPCRNEEQYMARCLDSILGQDYPDHLIEVLVADGKSNDGTVGIVDSYHRAYPGIQLLSNEKQTTSYGLNLGIKHARGGIIIILGAHAELFPDYVTQCLAAFSNSDDIGCTGGVLENVYESGTAEIIGLAMSSVFGVGNAHFRTGSKEGSVDTVAFGAYKRIVFDKAGLFDEELIRCQDDEFNFRVLKAGFQIFLSSKIKCRYFVRGSFQKLWRQYYQYGYWKVYANKKNNTITTSRQLVPLFFVLYLMGGILFSVFFPFLRIPFLVILSLYIGASLASALLICRKMKQVLPIMGTFFILHFSYGCGYLWGINHFLLLNRNVKLDAKTSR